MAQFEVNDGTGFKMNYEAFAGLLPQNTLFIHGNLASNGWWYPLKNELEKSGSSSDLSLGGQMILAEFRGCGQSSVPKNTSEVNMDRFADDMIALVEAKGWAPLNLVGHSTGGFIACLMMAKRPELFHRMVLLDSVGPRGIVFNDSMGAAFDQMKANKDIVTAVMNTTIHNNDASSEFFKNVVVENAFNAVQCVGWPVVQSLGNVDIRPQLQKIEADVLVIHGEKDVVIPVADSQEMAASLPNAQLVILKDHGHSLNVESPSKLAELMKAHLFAKPTETARQATLH